MTFDFLMDNARQLRDAWHAWNMQDGPYVPWLGHQTKAISDQLRRVIEAISNNTSDATAGKMDAKGYPIATRETNPDARGLMLALDRVAYEYHRWLRGASTGQDWAVPAGSSDLTSALNRLAEMCNQRKLPAPEPMAVLRAIGAPLRSVAIKYGWKNADGSPDEQRAQIALANADQFDKDFDPSSWIHPAVAAAQADVDAEWAQRAPRAPLFIQEPSEDQRPEPPSIEDMIKAKAPAQQIVNVWGKRMPELTTSYVEEMAKEMGVSLDDDRYSAPVSVNPGVATVEAIAQQERVDAAKRKAQERLAAS